MDKVINFPGRAKALRLPPLPEVAPLPAGTTPAKVSSLLEEVAAALSQLEQHLDTLRSAALLAAAQKASDPGAAADLWHSEHVQPIQDLGWNGAWARGFYDLSGCVAALAEHLQEWRPAQAQMGLLHDRYGALEIELETVANVIEEGMSADRQAD